MYSINVFLTFSLSNLGDDAVLDPAAQASTRTGGGTCPSTSSALALCLTILVVTCFEKFAEGGWLTLVITGVLVGFVLLDQAPLRAASSAPSAALDVELARSRSTRCRRQARDDRRRSAAIDPDKPGRGPLRRRLRRPRAPRAAHAACACSPGTSRASSSARSRSSTPTPSRAPSEVHALETRTRRRARAVRDASRATLGLPAERELSTGTEVAVEAEKLGLELIRRYPKALFVAGQLIFEEDTSFGPHPPQRDGVHDPAAPPARGRADDRPAGAPVVRRWATHENAVAREGHCMIGA